MKFIVSFLTILLFSLAGICNAEITGTVVDAETGKPIEGAVVLVEWTITKGMPGMSHTESYKIIEGLTDKTGEIKILEIHNPLTNQPYITIYKKGYVTWNSEYIFPNYKKRTDFQRKEINVFKLEKFALEYKYQSHVSFIHHVIRLGVGEKKMMTEAIEWEESKAFEERQKNK